MSQLPAQPPTHQTIRSYRGHREYEAGIAHMQRQGWRVMTVATEQRSGPGCLRVVLLGPFAFIGRRRATYSVTFTR